MKRIIMAFLTIMCTFAFSGFNLAASAQTTGEIAKGNCKSCADKAQKTMDYCNTKKGKYGTASVTNALKDCVTACKMTADFLERGSVLQGKSCAVAIEACNNCAKAMDSFPDDKDMTACANECRKCVGNCQKLSAK